MDSLLPQYKPMEQMGGSDGEPEPRPPMKERELCPRCGAHLTNWKEMLHEDHYCPIDVQNNLTLLSESATMFICQSCGNSFRFEGTGYAKCPHCRAVNFVFNSDKGKCIMLY